MAFKFDFKKWLCVFNNLERADKWNLLTPGIHKEPLLSDSSAQKQLELSAVVLVVEARAPKFLIFLYTEMCPEYIDWRFPFRRSALKLCTPWSIKKIQESCTNLELKLFRVKGKAVFMFFSHRSLTYRVPWWGISFMSLTFLQEKRKEYFYFEEQRPRKQQLENTQ